MESRGNKGCVGLGDSLEILISHIDWKGAFESRKGSNKPRGG